MSYTAHLMVFGIVLLAASTLMAAAATPATDYIFNGRWDLRSGTRAITNNSGSYVLAQFTGATLTALFDVSVNQPPLPTLAWQIDQGDWQEAEVADRVTLAEGLGAGPHRVMLMVRGLDEHQNRWRAPLIAGVTFLGLALPPDGKLLPPLKAWRKPKFTMEFLGDSITEGVLVQDERPGKTTPPWRADARQGYAGQTALRLGAAWRQVGFGATGLIHGGNGGAPSALDSFNACYDGCPRDTWQPDVVVINQGTNDADAPASDYRALYASYLTMIRVAYPNAKIVALEPFCGAQAEAIRGAVDDAKAAGDTDLFFIDTTGWYTGPLHPNVQGSAQIADKLADALRKLILVRK